MEEYSPVIFPQTLEKILSGTQSDFCVPKGYFPASTAYVEAMVKHLKNYASPDPRKYSTRSTNFRAQEGYFSASAAHDLEGR